MVRDYVSLEAKQKRIPRLLKTAGLLSAFVSLIFALSQFVVVHFDTPYHDVSNLHCPQRDLKPDQSNHALHPASLSFNNTPPSIDSSTKSSPQDSERPTNKSLDFLSTPELRYHNESIDDFRFVNSTSVIQSPPSSHSSSLEVPLTRRDKIGSEFTLAERVRRVSNTPAGLSVYVYELPAEWESGLLAKFPRCREHQWAQEVKIPELIRDYTPSLQPENPDDADFYLVPFPTKCYFNFVAQKKYARMTEVFLNILSYLQTAHPWWTRSGGRDHIFSFPSGVGAALFPTWSTHMPHSIFLVAEGDRTMSHVNTWKDIVVPGVSEKWMKVQSPVPLSERTIFAFFRGKFNYKYTDPEGKEQLLPLKLRRQLARQLADTPTNQKVIFKEETLYGSKYIHEVSHSVFCLCPRGGTPWTRRLFDSVRARCVPIIISDHVELPFEDFLPYEQFSIKIAEEEAMKPGKLMEFLNSLSDTEVQKKIDALTEVSSMFQYENGNALNAILWQLDRKTRLFRHSSNRTWTSN